MLRVSGLTLSAGGRSLVIGLSFHLRRGDRLAVVGPNGAGKTTLLRVLAGRAAVDAGTVEFQRSCTVGFLDQTPSPSPFVVPSGDDALHAWLAEIASSMAVESSPAALAVLERDYQAALVALIGHTGVQPPVFAGEVPSSSRSMGERQRIALDAEFAAHPSLLLLDEPTNHLDLDAITHLESRLAALDGAVVFVSHDRAFVDAVATHVLSIDPATRSATLQAGGYSTFVEARRRHHERQVQAFARQQRREQALKGEIAAIESRARHIENATVHFYFRKRAAKVARRAVTLKARAQREINSLDHLAAPPPPAMGIDARFPRPAPASSVLLSVERLSLCAGSRALLDGASVTVRAGERIALLGPNGSGKSTLLRAIADGTGVAAGRVALSGSARTGLMSQDDGASDFDGDAALLTPVAWLRRHLPMAPAEAANALHRFLPASASVRTPIARLTPGERRRLALARLMLSGFNLLLLDEPTNHLDIPGRDAFEAVLAAFTGAAIVATHDRYLVERFATRLLAIEGGRLVERPLPGGSQY